MEEITTKAWVSQQWLHFLQHLATKNISSEKLAELDNVFDFANSKNSSIAKAWYLLALQNGYMEIIEPLKQYLKTIGNIALIVPLYQKLLDKGYHDIVVSIYREASPIFHPTLQSILRELLY